MPKPPLYISQILEWADAYHQRTRRWPKRESGRIPETLDTTWQAVNMALSFGRRCLPGGSSLAQLLAKFRGVRNKSALPPLHENKILAWAQAYHDRTGKWPADDSGPIPEAPGETWRAVDSALRQAARGLPGGSSLACLLAEHRGVRNHLRLARFSLQQILAWADAYHERTGRWPNLRSGPIPEATGDSWSAVDAALRKGLRGLPGSSSLARLLAVRRRARNQRSLVRFSIPQILAWAYAHYQRTGRWPKRKSGPIPEAPGETWGRVHSALFMGVRGLPGGMTLAGLLAEKRGVRNPKHLSPLSIGQILAWADVHYRRTGQWPREESGPIEDAEGETWKAVAMALRRGNRSLPGGSSLARVLAQHRGVRKRPRRLTPALILSWADAHYQRTGGWPTESAGLIPGAEGTTWSAVTAALRHGRRGLPGGSSLYQLLKRCRLAGASAL